MPTYLHRIYIEWGTDSAPASVYVLDTAGVKHTPTLTTPIAEITAGSGNYQAVATYDTAWGAAVDMWTDGDGGEFPGDGAVPADVRLVAGGPASLDTGGGSGGSGTGSGDFAVDHDGGAGVTVDGVAAATDCLRILAGANGVDNVEIAAFLAATYTAGSRGAGDRAGTTYTGSDGRWEAPLMLDNGTYVLVFSRNGYLIGTSSVVVP